MNNFDVDLVIKAKEPVRPYIRSLLLRERENYILMLQKLSVMVNVTKGILVECDPAMKQVHTHLLAMPLPVAGFVTVSLAS